MAVFAFVRVKDTPTLEGVDLLRAGEADMDGLERWRFLPDRLVAIVPRDFSLSGSLTYASIRDHPLIALNENVASSQFLNTVGE